MSTTGSSARRRAGRPRRPPITESRIAETALALIDEEGWDACTMTTIAGRLDVRAPSLYHHVRGQRGIVDLVRGLISAEITDPAIVGLPWDEAMYEFGLAYYRVFTDHPNAIQVLSSTPVRDRPTLQMYEIFLEALTRSGWSADRAYEALCGLEHLALGFAFEWNAEDVLLDPESCRELGAPILARVIEGQGSDQALIAERSFRSLLRRYIDMFRE